MRRLIFIFLPFALLACKTTKESTHNKTTQSNQHVETIYQTIDRDSISIRDSIVMHANGTKSSFHNVSKSKIKIVHLYHLVQVLKTITINKNSTTVKPVKVKEPLTWFQQLFIFLGKITSIYILILVLWWFLKLKLKIKL